MKPFDKKILLSSVLLFLFLSEGYYTVRAYTSYMRNAGDDCFFEKHIRIGSVSANQPFAVSEKKKAAIDYEVSFYPEGGNLLEGVLSKVAFKALNANGSSAFVSGTITDKGGNIVASMETLHTGMGVFGFIPEKGNVYYADCTNPNGKKKRFRLPEAKSNAYSLTVTRGRNGRLRVGRHKSADSPPFPASNLLIHCRGIILYAGPWDSSREYFVFYPEEFPSGVIQIVLLDEQENPLSERLVFIRNDDQAHVAFSTDKESYAIREQVTSKLTVTGTDGTPLAGNYSVSVVDNKDQAVDHTTSILSTLLLTSDLKGYIESPDYYFQTNDDNSTQLTDCLMLTHGWRRYTIPEAAKKQPVAHPEYPAETSLSVSGKVTTLLTGHPVTGSKVNMITMSTGETFDTQTTGDGRFVFDGFEFPDSTKFILRAEKVKGSTSVELRLDEKTYPPLKALPFEPDTAGIIRYKPEETTGTFIEKASERSKYDEEMRIVHLQDVEIIARRQDKDPKPVSVFSMYSNRALGVAYMACWEWTAL